MPVKVLAIEVSSIAQEAEATGATWLTTVHQGNDRAVASTIATIIENSEYTGRLDLLSQCCWREREIGNFQGMIIL